MTFVSDDSCIATISFACAPSTAPAPQRLHNAAAGAGAAPAQRLGRSVVGFDSCVPFVDLCERVSSHR
jgi:hypothetical protein